MKLIKVLVLFLLLSKAPVYSVAVDSASWPQFRGPNGSGVAIGDNPAPVEFSRKKKLLWEMKLPAGHSSPCIVGDKIFLTAFEKDAQGLETICIDRAKGAVLWRHSVEAKKIEKVHKISNPATATPVSDGKAVYVYFGSFGLVAYDFDGKELWKKSLPMPILNAGGGSYGNGTSPILADDMVLLDMHLQENSHLLAVRCKDGETVWKTSEPDNNYGYSTPAIWKEAGDEVIGVLNGGKFTVFNLKDGSERWWITGLPLQTIASPVLGGDKVFLNGTGVLGAAENTSVPPTFDEALKSYDTNKDDLISVSELPPSLLYADRGTTTGTGSMSVHWYLRAFGGKNKDAKMDRKEWDAARDQMKNFSTSYSMKTAVYGVRLGGKGDVTKQNVVWSETKGVSEVPSALFYRKRLYMVKSGGLATCLDPATGKILFQERLGVVGGFFSSPVATDGKIYVGSDAGKLVVFEAKDSLRVVATNDLKEPIMATPAIVDGKIYVRTTDHLFAFGN